MSWGEDREEGRTAVENRFSSCLLQVHYWPAIVDLATAQPIETPAFIVYNCIIGRTRLCAF